MGRLSGKVTLLPVGLSVCLCFASALLTPDPVLATTELLHPPAGGGYTTYDLPQIASAVERARSYTAGSPGALTYLGESFNYVALAMHVPSDAILFPYALSPASDQSVVQSSVSISMTITHVGWCCRRTRLPHLAPGVCGRYRAIGVQGLTYGQLQELK